MMAMARGVSCEDGGGGGSIGHAPADIDIDFARLASCWGWAAVGLTVDTLTSVLGKAGLDIGAPNDHKTNMAIWCNAPSLELQDQDKYGHLA